MINIKVSEPDEIVRARNMSLSVSVEIENTELFEVNFNYTEYEESNSLYEIEAEDGLATIEVGDISNLKDNLFELVSSYLEGTGFEKNVWEVVDKIIEKVKFMDFE